MAEPAFESPNLPEQDDDREVMGVRERNLLQRAVVGMLRERGMQIDADWLAENGEQLSDFLDGNLPEYKEQKEQVWALVAAEEFEQAARLTIDTLSL